MKTTTTIKFILMILFGVSLTLKSQTPNNVGIGTTTPDNSAILHLKSSNQGFLMTTLSTNQINAISNPTIGLLTYNTDDNCYWYKHPNGWKRICNTDSLGNVFINTITTNTINAQTINTNTIIAGTSTFTNVTTNTFTTNVINFGNGIGDSIWVHYAQIDTAVINRLTVQTIKADSIYLGGNSITTVITDSITNLAWLLKGNNGTNPAINFLGTIDNQRLVIRTNNTEKMTVLSTGEVGIGLNNPTNKLEVVGNTKTTNFQMTSGAAAGLIMQSTSATGTGSWSPLATLVSTLAPSTFSANAWTLLGNGGTNPAINFLGTIDNQRLVIRTNNTEKMTVLSTGEVGIGLNNPTNKLEVVGNTKTTNFQMTSGAAAGLIMQSTSATGTGSWSPLATLVSTLAPSTFSANAWTLLGNGGTNPAINFLGTTDNQRLVVRTNNTEKMTVLSTGEVGIGLNNPTNKLEVVGNTKTTNFQMTSGAAAGLIMQSTSATGTGSWSPLATLVSTLAPSTFSANAWTILGNAGTGLNNFIGTTDPANFHVRVNNENVARFSQGTLALNDSIAAFTGPQFTFLNGMASGLKHTGNDNNSSTNPTLNLFFNNGSAYKTVIGADYTGNILSSLSSASTSTYTIFKSNNNFAYSGSIFDNSNRNYAVNTSVFNVSNDNIVLKQNEFLPTNTLNSSDNNVVIGTGNTFNTTINSFLLGASTTVSNLQNVVVISRSGSSPLTNLNTANSSINMVTQGGFRLYSNSILTTGVSLAPGGGAWASISDRNLKENITPISNKKILEKILQIPVTEWTYITQKVDTMNKYAVAGQHYDKAPVHIGPMAQDFSEVFGYGEYKDKITSSDIDGVMFAAIQALAEENKELKNKLIELEQFKKELDELRKLLIDTKNR